MTITTTTGADRRAVARMKALFALALSFVCLASQPARADNVDPALEAFHRICLAQGPDFERTAAAAKERGWVSLSRDAFAVLAPVKDATAFQGWEATGSSMPAKAMIGVTKATLRGKAVQTCTIALFDVDGAAFEQRFFARTDAEKIGEERDGAQVSKLFFLIAGDRKQLVHLTSPGSPNRRNMLIASSVADDR